MSLLHDIEGSFQVANPSSGNPSSANPSSANTPSSFFAKEEFLPID